MANMILSCFSNAKRGIKIRFVPEMLLAEERDIDYRDSGRQGRRGKTVKFKKSSACGETWISESKDPFINISSLQGTRS